MSRLGIFGLVLVLLIQTLSASLIVVNYSVNKTYIIENFCENTDKPQLQCNGKCHLNKQIKEDAEHKSETPITVNELSPLILFCQEMNVVVLRFQSDLQKPLFGRYLEKSYSTFLQTIFHPPQI